MNSELDNNFLDWLAGFVEVNGSFEVDSQGNARVVIVEDYKNINVLYLLKKTLGFGRVVKQGPRAFRYIVPEKEDVLKILGMFHDRLVFPENLAYYNNFVTYCNNSFKVQLNHQLTPKEVTLEDSWLSGLVDGAGSFNISYMLTKQKFNISFAIAQPFDTTFLTTLIPESRCGYNTVTGDFEFAIAATESADHYKFAEVIQYFMKFQLRTRKNNSFYLWYYAVSQLYFTRVDPNKKNAIISLVNLTNE